MSPFTKIEWKKSDGGIAGATWNSVTGFTKLSTGCDDGYAETFTGWWRGIPGHHFENGFDVPLRPELVDQPLRWKRSKRVFVNSTSDLFHDWVPLGFVCDVRAVHAGTPQHNYEVITKRSTRLARVADRLDWPPNPRRQADEPAMERNNQRETSRPGSGSALETPVAAPGRTRADE